MSRPGDPGGVSRPLTPAERLVVALDVSTLDEAAALVSRLRPVVGWFKVGLELYSAAGPAALRMVKERGGRVFADLKLHDIPSAVARAAAVLVRAGADMLTVHASGGRSMVAGAVASAREVAGQLGRESPVVLAVTVLTSLGEADLAVLGMDRTPCSQVLLLARLAHEAGADGWVASPREAALLRREFGPHPLIVTPGIRPAGGAPGDDQVRVATPAGAVAAGADWLVVGRPITRTPDPRRAAEALLEEMGQGMGNPYFHRGGEAV